MTDVDPKTRPLLDMIALANEPPPSSMTVAEYRARRQRGRAFINIPAPDLPVIRDCEIAGAAGPLRARIYDVIDAPARPTLVYFHGGGFVFGDVDGHDPLCRRLCAAGRLRVISVDYRLAPEHPFPAAIEDAFAAARCIAAAPEAYGADPTRLAIGGDSAGANLAAVAAIRAAREGAFPLKHQLLIYPATQCVGPTPSRERYASGYFMTARDMAWFEEQYIPASADRRDERLSPLLADLPNGLAPAYVVTAGFDPLKDEGAAYAGKLAAAGVGVVHVDYPDQIHGFASFTAFSSVAVGAIEGMGRAVASALG